MSKELEALELLTDWARFGTDRSGQQRYSVTDLNELIKKSLTPPTQEEVCKALSEYINEPVWFDENNDIRISTQWVAKQLENYGLNFMCILPPKLVKMVAWFYEEEAHKCSK